MTSKEDWIALSGDGLDVIEWTAVDLLCREFLWPAAEMREGRVELGSIAIADQELVDVFVGGGLDELLESAESIVDEQGDNYGWPIALAIARRVCETKTTRVMRYVLAEESRIDGSEAGGDALEVSLQEEVTRPVCELLRSWCGAPAVTFEDRLAHAQSEIARLGEMFASAVALLADAGDEAASWAVYKATYPEAKKRDWRSTVRFDADKRERWRAGLPPQAL